MKHLLLPIIAFGPLAFGMAAAARAADYPPCSSTVQDECTNAPTHHLARSHKAHEHHAALHRGAKAKAETTAKS